jgi:ferredoxin-NADP reductase
MTATEMPPMKRLRVTRNERIADGIHLLELSDPNGHDLPAFTAGAYIPLLSPNGFLRK